MTERDRGRRGNRGSTGFRDGRPSKPEKAEQPVDPVAEAREICLRLLTARPDTGLPKAHALVALMFFGCIVWSATLLLRIRNGGAKFALPFLIYALTLAVLIYAPLQQIALQQNFHGHRQNRERIVARVEAGELKPNVDYNKNLIALGEREPNVSARGNDIVVDETDEGIYVLFLTSRGLKHYFTGFLRVPPGGDPNKFFEFEDKPPSRLVRYDKDWYFVAN